MRWFLLSLLCAACAPTFASTGPAQPRALVHGFQPTGPIEISGTLPANRVLRTMQRYAVPAWSDLLATHVAHTMQDEGEAAVSVVRKPRQSGFEAARVVAAAPPDGQTLLLATREPPASPGSELQPVALVATMPYVLVLRTGGAVNDARELIEQARRGSERVPVATMSAQTIGYSALDLLRRQVPALQPVAYNGGHAALQAIVGNQVVAGLIPLPSVMPYLGGGRIKVVAVADTQRHDGIPDVPTTADAGMSGLVAAGWFGVFAPSATASSTVRRLDALLARGPRSEQTVQFFSELGLRLEHRDPGQFAKRLAEDPRLLSKPL